MRFLRQSLVGMFLLAVTIGLLVYAGQMVWGAVSERMARENRPPQARERLFAVNVVEARADRIAPELVAFGEIESRRSLELRAKASGTIVRLDDAVIEGGQVAQGQLLLQIDPTVAQFALDRVNSDLLDAEAEGREAARALELAQAELLAAQEQARLRTQALGRQQDLQARDVGTAAAVEAAELSLASANQAVVARRQAVAQAEARIDQAATRLERTRIAQAEAQRVLAETSLFAEFSGTLSDVSVVKGGLVTPNERLATLIDATALEVSFRVSTPQYVRLLDERGALHPAEVRVMLDVMGEDLTATGVISREGAIVGDGQTGRQIFARLDAPRGLKPGDFVTVRVREAEIDGIIELPASALDARGRVMVVGDQDRLEAVEVDLLRRQADIILVRNSGLEGKMVVARLTPLLGPGIRVKPLVDGLPVAEAKPDVVSLSDARRAELIAFVEGNKRMPAEMKERLLGALAQPQVPAQVIERLESRMGG
ncbi:hypothetical protein NBRC116590_20070 [Pelagimonas sp. KU-00592-HH]|uniref:efflux RND transporter periplasmic adaptor subunit n=1 Tax=Pelagimonas sp. KU-00592-HH TaxID=3127651 RepID=UPI00310BF649